MSRDYSGLSPSMTEYIMTNWRDMTSLLDVDQPFTRADVGEVPWGVIQKFISNGLLTDVGRTGGNNTIRVWEIDSRVLKVIEKCKKSNAGDCESSVLPCKCGPGVSNVKSDDGPAAYECPHCGMDYLECEVKDDVDTSGLWRDEDVLHFLYIERRLSIEEVAEVLGAGETTINRWIHRADGIEPRGRGGRRPEYPKVADEAWFREQYVVKGLSTREIAKERGCSQTIAAEWLQKHDIEPREHPGGGGQKEASA